MSRQVFAYKQACYKYLVYLKKWRHQFTDPWHEAMYYLNQTVKYIICLIRLSSNNYDNRSLNQPTRQRLNACFVIDSKIKAVLPFWPCTASGVHRLALLYLCNFIVRMSFSGVRLSEYVITLTSFFVSIQLLRCTTSVFPVTSDMASHCWAICEEPWSAAGTALVKCFTVDK